MKKTLLSALAAFALITSIFYLASCGTEDLCANVDCGPHGKCNATTGTCDCDAGYKKDTNGRCDLLIDPCSTANCGANATCDKGVCSCTAGYEKDAAGKCTVVTKEKLYGDYDAEDFDPKGVSLTGKYTSAIASVATDVTKVTIKNLGFYECKNVTSGAILDYFVEATVKGDSVLINNKTCNNQYTGKGFYDKTAKTLTINYTAVYPDPKNPTKNITDVNKAILKKK
jgi:hypothetical protein